MYRWYQETGALTVDIFVAPRTQPSDLKLVLSKQRLTLRKAHASAAAEPILCRRLYAKIEPRCTASWTMPMAQQSSEHAVVRVVLYKSILAGWISLFADDPPTEGLVPGPAPMSHPLAHAAAAARGRQVAAQESRDSAARAYYCNSSSQPGQTWRRGCGTRAFKTAGGTKYHYVREAPVRASARDAGEKHQARGTGEGIKIGACQSQSWRATRRPAPFGGRLQAEEMERLAAERAALLEEETEPLTSQGPTKRDAAAARAAIQAVRKGESLVQAGDAVVGGGSDDDGDGDDPDDEPYPMPGSDAMCDGCAAIVNRYYHCVECGILDGFDLCERCHRQGVWPDEHRRRHPTHHFGFVSTRSAPLIARSAREAREGLTAAPGPSTEPPQQSAAAALATPGGALSQRVILPLEAPARYRWTQYSHEVNVDIDLPLGTRARDLSVIVKPFTIAASHRRAGLLLRGSLHKCVRHTETVWTIEEGTLRLVLVKSDGQSWRKLFPQEAEIQPHEAIKQLCDDPEPATHGYMDLSSEARQLVDLHRNHRRALATGDYDLANELEEDMTLMRFKWPTDKQHMEA